MRSARRRWLGFCILGLSAAAFAWSQPADSGEDGDAALQALLRSLAANDALQATLIEKLPIHLQGRLVAIGEFDDRQGKWMPMKGPQDFGLAGEVRLTVLGHEVGEGGFVAARYKAFTDRDVVSYTGLTPDRRMSVNLYDDPQDTEHLVLTIRIGPRQLRYLLRRPAPR